MKPISRPMIAAPADKFDREYIFRPMTAADLPMLRYWLDGPHVAEWWGDAAEQFALVRGDLNEPAMEQFVVAIGDRPFAYLQCYDSAAWPDNGLGVQPEGTLGMDQFIGEPDMIGRGHGSAFIRNFVERLINSGTPRVVTDPDPANRRAPCALMKKPALNALVLWIRPMAAPC